MKIFCSCTAEVTTAASVLLLCLLHICIVSLLYISWAGLAQSVK